MDCLDQKVCFGITTLPALPRPIPIVRAILHIAVSVANSTVITTRWAWRPSWIAWTKRSVLAYTTLPALPRPIPIARAILHIAVSVANSMVITTRWAWWPYWIAWGVWLRTNRSILAYNIASVAKAHSDRESNLAHCYICCKQHGYYNPLGLVALLDCLGGLVEDQQVYFGIHNIASVAKAHSDRESNLAHCCICCKQHGYYNLLGLVVLDLEVVDCYCHRSCYKIFGTCPSLAHPSLFCYNDCFSSFRLSRKRN